MTDNGKEPVQALVLDGAAEPALDPATIHAAVAHADQPCFDFSGLSWDEGMDIANFGARILDISNDATLTGLEQARRIRAVMDEIKGTMARITVSVPRAWLVRSAPAVIDWTQPASFGRYLQPAYAKQMIGLMSELMYADPNG